MDNFVNWKPGEILYKDSQIYTATEQYILNTCATNFNFYDSKVSLQIPFFEKFQYSNIYGQYATKSEFKGFKEMEKLGTIKVMGDSSKKQKLIVNMFVQEYFRFPQTDKNSIDTVTHRLGYFEKCLELVYKLKNIESVAMAQHIGSGVGGELWDKYKHIIEQMALKNSKIKTVMYAAESLPIDDLIKKI